MNTYELRRSLNFPRTVFIDRASGCVICEVAEWIPSYTGIPVVDGFVPTPECYRFYPESHFLQVYI